MNYKQYAAEDFAADAYFQRWVQAPDLETNTFWLNWLEQNPDKQGTLATARKLVRSIRVEENEYSDDFLTKIWQNIDQQISSKPATYPMPVARESREGKFFGQYRNIAAALLVLMLATALFIALYLSGEKYATGYGETKTIVLPDNSVVTLNANSILKYNTGWSEQQVREVWLEGEAFFHVRKRTALSKLSPGAKFIVHTGLMDVEVLGTQFNVNTRRGKAQVVLNSGKVKLNSEIAGKPNSIYMEPGELVELTQGTNFTKRVVNPTNFSAWKNKQLIFDKTPIVEIAKTLEDTYGWQVTIADAQLSEMTFTSTISAENPEVLLKLLSESFHINISRKGNQVIIGNPE